jgi:hypothetical protein
MLNATKPWWPVTAMLSLLLLPIFSGCAHGKPYYFNASDKIYTTVNGEVGGERIRQFCSEDGKQCTKTDYNCVAMSEGKFREIVTVPVDK